MTLRTSWSRAAMIFVACLFGCEEAPAPVQHTVDPLEDEAYWIQQLHPAGASDAQRAVALAAAQRYLSTVPEPTKQRLVAETSNLALSRCFQLVNVANGLHALGRFDEAKPYYDELLGRSDCPTPRSSIVRRAVLARHQALPDQPPINDPAALDAIATELIGFEATLPEDESSAELTYEIAVLQHWSDHPDQVRLRGLMSIVEEQLAARTLDQAGMIRTVLYMANDAGNKLHDYALVQRAAMSNDLFQRYGNPSAFF
jgi:hypothetical protein